MLLGYNTNGLAHHRLADAIELLAAIGYESVAITVDHHSLNPFDPGLADEIQLIRKQLGSARMASVIETGARFLLDPLIKHEPTLLTSSDVHRGRRIDFLIRCVDIAQALGSSSVSLWSGILRGDESDDTALERLADGLQQVLDYAEPRGIELAFEPEPGMFVDTMSRFERLLQWVDAPHLRLTVDVGHLYCQGEVPIVDYLARWSDRIANVHIEDMRAGVHEHLMFGDGEMDFPPIIDGFAAIEYEGPIHVELSRHSHEGPQAARVAYDFLRPLIDGADGAR